MKKKPINTTKMANDNPLAILADALLNGTNNAVERQEARGQYDFVASTTLPTKIRDKNGRELLEKAGVVFGDVVEDDEIFQYVSLPDGWKKETTDHSMWSKLVDGKGRERASIFYKAAFYDRSSLMHLSRRFSFENDYERRDSDGLAVTKVTDCGTVIYETNAITPKKGETSWDFFNESEKIAASWLDKKYPKWNDVSAYWD